MITDIDRRLQPVIAHRGASGKAPENTLAALRLAKTEGANWVEFDVKLSRDGQCILMHDELLQRTTNGKGQVAQYDLDELKRLDAGSWFAMRFAGERIPTLEEAIATCIERDVEINLEIKPCPSRGHETAIRVVEDLRRHWPADRPWPLISSFAVPALEAVRLHAPEMPRGLLIGRRVTRRALEMLDRLECVALHCDARGASAELANRLRARGRPLLCYTVNDGKWASRLMDMGVASIITDQPAEVRAMLGAPQ